MSELGRITPCLWFDHEAEEAARFYVGIFRNAKIVNDSIAQCIDKGETFHPLNRGIITMDDIHGEIGEILLGRKPGRESDEEITIFDSTGMAIQDNTTAYKIYQNAIENHVGTFFEFMA